jgi:hypothetical protein
MNALKDRFANLAMPEPIKTALQKEMAAGLHQASLPPTPSKAMANLSLLNMPKGLPPNTRTSSTS